MAPAPFLLAVLLLPAAPAGDDADVLLDRLKTEDPAERRKALEDLRGRGAEAVPAAIRCLEGGPADLGGRVEDLVRRLSSKTWKERDEASRSLAKLGRRARPILEGIKEPDDPEVRWRLRAAMDEIREGEGRDEHLERARDLALCGFLAEAGDPRAVRPLLALAAGKGGTPPELRLGAAEALGRLRDRLEPAQREEAAERVLEALSDLRNPLEGTAKARLIRVLGRLRSPSCVRPLAALLGDRSEKNVHVKRLAMAALAAVGDGPALRALVEGLLSEEIYVRQGAAALVGDLAGGGFGFDPRAPIEANREAILKARAWWSGKFGKAWEEQGP